MIRRRPDCFRIVSDTNVRPSGCTVEIVAHRGASIEAPENTRAAVELAWQLRADAVEIDVQLSRDGHLAVIHDESLKRTANVESLVGDLLMSDLQKVDVGAWKGNQWRGETLVELPDILATIPPGRRLFVELKSDGSSEASQAIITALQRDLLNTAIAPESVVLISFYPALLRAARESLPQFEAFLVVQQEPVSTEPTGTGSGSMSWQPSIKEIIDTAVRSGFHGVDLSNTEALTREAITSIRQANLTSCVWTVNSPADGESSRDCLTLQPLESLCFFKSPYR